MTIFHSAALKLTAWYLSLIMIVSIGCSLAIYQLSRDQLINNTRRQVYFFNDVLEPSDFRSFSQLRQRQLEQGLNRLKGNLVFFNTLVLIGGGAAAYALARRTLRPIENSLAAQTRFTGDASHELRTPLTAMQTEIEVALRDKSLTKKDAVELLQSNLEEVAKLKALSEGLLRLASSDTRKPDHKVDLASAAEAAADKWRKAASTKRVELKTELNPAFIAGDEQALHDMASILIDNAIKYSKEKGGTVSVRTYQDGKESFLEVSDSGQGIEASELPRIFERFYRSDSSRSKLRVQGYGLGLSIAKQIVELHQGSIEVKSSLGKGSVFIVRLPAVKS